MPAVWLQAEVSRGLRASEGLDVEADLAEARRLLADAAAAAQRAQQQLDGASPTKCGLPSLGAREAGQLWPVPAASSPGAVQALAADNARLLAECEAAVHQLRDITASMQQQQRQRQAEAPGKEERRQESAVGREPCGRAQPEVRQLQRELDEVGSRDLPQHWRCVALWHPLLCTRSLAH